MSNQPEFTQAQIDEALDTAALANGYEEIITWGPGALAMDLLEHNQLFEDARPSSIIPLIRDWQRRHGGESIEVTWQSGPSGRRETVAIPKVSMDWARDTYVQSLERQLAEATRRANSAALETITYGRHLSIAVKALEGTRGIMVAVQKLRRFTEGDGNPLSSAMSGWLAAQDGKELDAAVEAAAKAMLQLEKEYPNDAGPAPKVDRTYTHGIHEESISFKQASCKCGGVGCWECAPPEHR